MSNNNVLMLNVGSEVVWGNEKAQIMHASKENFLLRFQSGRHENFSPMTIHDAYFNNTLRLAEKTNQPFIFQTVANTEMLEKLNRLTAYLQALDKEATPCSIATRRKVIAEVSKKYAYMSESTLYRSYKKWRNAGRNILVFTKNYRKKRTSKFSDDMLDLIEEIIQDEYLTRGGPSVSECYTKLEEYFKSRQIEGTCVSKSRFYEICDSIDEIEETLARIGKEAARNKSQSTAEKIWADFPLQYVEIDAVHLNLGIVDAETNEFLGTLIVYVAIDRYSRCVLGYATSIKRPGKGEQTESVIACIKHATLPKKELPHCQNQWSVYGLANDIICDAGSAFNNITVTSYVLNIGCSRVITPTKTPKKKPFIERFFRTFREQLAKKIPGYVAKRLAGDPIDETTQQLACMCEHEVHMIIEQYICDFYHQSAHKGLDNAKPIDVWNAYYEKTMMTPRLPLNNEVVNAFVGTSFYHVLNPNNGISINKQTYNSTPLRDLYFLLKKEGFLENNKIEGIANKNDISKIFVINPMTMEMVLIPCTDKRIKTGTKLSDVEATAPNTPATKCYMSKDSALFDPGKNRLKAKRAEKQRRKGAKPATPRTTTEKLTKTDLEGMMSAGTVRTAHKIETPTSEVGTTDQDNSSIFDGLDEVECK